MMDKVDSKIHTNSEATSTVSSEDLATGITAFFTERAINTDIQNSLESLAKSTRKRIAEIYKNAYERACKMNPDVPWAAPGENAGIESFTEYLNGKVFHDSSENQ